MAIAPLADRTDDNSSRWEIIASLLEQAAETPEAQRAAFVAKACAGDESLRREVMSLLEAAAAPSGPLERFLDAFTPAPNGRESAPSSRIGPYELLHEIGHGGMGVVYLARRADGQYQRQVALKISRAPFFGAATNERFFAERDILAGLTHPHIATFFDAGVTPEGYPYFTMEYVDGRPIDAHCDANTLDLTARLRLFLDVCQAVAAAHQNLVVHRDLKPSNVFVTNEGRVKLLDFGIAKLLAPDEQHDIAVTGTDARLMTPQYASPEQMGGRRVSTSTDVYALGLLLYELLCGHRAHRFRSKSLADLERAVVHEDPLRPSDAVSEPDPSRPGATADAISRSRRTTPTRLSRRLRGDLDRIVAMALRKEPERRYGSVLLLAEDVERFLNGQPVRARGDSSGYRLGKFIRRHRVGVAAAAAAVAMVVGYAILATRHAREMERAAAIARMEASKADEVSDFLVGLFEANDPDLAQGNEVTGRELLEQGVRQAGLLSAQPAVQAEMLSAIGRVYLGMGRVDQAKAIVERSLDLSRKALGEGHVDVGRRYRQLGVVLRSAGDFAASERTLRRALEIDTAAAGARSADAAADEHELGYTLLQLKQLDEGERLLRASLDLRRSLFGNVHEDVATSLSGVAYARARRGFPREAVPLYREALAVRTARLGEHHPEIARAHQNLAVLLTDIAEYSEAESHLQKAMAVYRIAYGDAHPSIAVTLNNLGRISSLKGDLTEGERLFSESAAMRRTLLGPEHPATLLSMANLATVFVSRGDYQKAESLLRQVMEVERRRPENISITTMGSLAETLRQQKKLDEAERLHREALALARHRGVRTLDEAAALAGLGRVLTNRKAHAEALDVLTLALEIRRERLGDTHPSVTRTRGYLKELADAQR